MSLNQNYCSWENRTRQVKKFYASMTKGEKSKFLNELNRVYELIPNTISRKLSGIDKIKPVEVFVLEIELQKRGYKFNFNKAV